MRVTARGLKKYPGNAEAICKSIVKNCFNGRYFQVSNHNYQNFYCRDFGWCCKALLELGYRKEVEKTLDYALSVFERHGAISVAITKKGKPFNFPNVYSIDSVSYFFYALRLLNNKKIIKKYLPFLKSEVKKFCSAIDRKTGLVKPLHFSAMRDHAIRKSSCYDNVMVMLMQQSLKTLQIKSALQNYDFKKIIKEQFWNGSYFYDDLTKTKEVSADANILPFYFGLFAKPMLKKVVATLQKNNLDKPFPLKYSNTKKGGRFIFYELFVKNWERDSIWSQLGMIYINILQSVDRKKASLQLEQYKKIIEEHKTFLELFSANGQPYKSPFYYSDEGMIWACMYLALQSSKQKIAKR